MFKAEFYKNNRANLAKLCPESIIIIAGNSLMQRTGDTNFIFRQDSNLLYLTGLLQPNTCLVINAKTGEEFIMLDKKTGTAEIFDGNFDESEISRVSGVALIKNYKDGLDYIVTKSKSSTVMFNDALAWNKVDFTINNHRQSVKRRLQARRIKIENVSPNLANMRMIKQPQEIEAIEQAVKITKQALTLAEQGIASVKNEQLLLATINVSFAKQGVVHAYEPIVASGKNATILHYVKNNASINNGDVVLFDVGAEVSGYAADISRTYIKGQNTRAVEIIKVVQGIQAAIISQIKPGATWKGLSELALKLTAKELIRLKVITEQKDAQKYFPHTFGHFLGLDVHDAGDYTQPLAENIVLTVEPGIYIPEEGIGVRIEDDILVTKTGAKLL